ncbi:MAG: diguanylate cyclase [Planctomycetes bacterium]|nr:diguanylate cyclase [Planctomycetota bacterium]
MSEAPTGGRILVVDDNATNALLLTQTLKKHGHEVLVARDGVAALESARQAQPDLILLDIMMPAVDGFEVCRRLKANRGTAGIPVIFVTACARSEDVVRALGLGASDYVTKPFVMAEVVARISVQLRLRRAERELIAKNVELARLAQDLTSRNAELAILSRTDPLTGLLNRRAWYEAAETEAARSLRYGGCFGVAMIDVDHFKMLNDSRGHREGDDCLRDVAKAIESTCRVTDVAGRYGGEEFVVLMPETSIDGAVAAGERMREAVWALDLPHARDLAPPRVTVSIGVAVDTGQSLPLAETIRAADAALYAAKHAGRNCVRQGARQPRPAARATPAPD